MDYEAEALNAVYIANKATNRGFCPWNEQGHLIPALKRLEKAGRIQCYTGSNDWRIGYWLKK